MLDQLPANIPIPHKSPEQIATPKQNEPDAELSKEQPLEAESPKKRYLRSTTNSTILQQCEDSANNNSDDLEPDEETGPKLADGQQHVTLEALENTKVAVAQFAATALANGADETALKDLAMLQSTLFTLQHQQVYQLRLIEQLQSQLTTNPPRVKKGTEKVEEPEREIKDEEPKVLAEARVEKADIGKHFRELEVPNG